MRSEKKYPYIGKLLSSVDMIAMFTSENTATPLTSNFDDTEVGKWDSDWYDKHYTNITHKHLQNTWGVVESKEHAEFIVELAELHEFKLLTVPYEKYPCWFGFDGDEIYIVDNYHCVSTGNEKQITIPLPPKLNSPEVPDSSDIKNCRSELVDLEAWPRLGDPVTVYGQQGEVILPADKNGFYIINSDGLYLAAKIEEITKPKSKEDLLIEELQTKLCENNYVDNYTLANDIVNGMIEGLRYETK